MGNSGVTSSATFLNNIDKSTWCVLAYKATCSLTKVSGVPPEADQVSLLRPPGFGGQAGVRCHSVTRCQVSGVRVDRAEI